VVDVVVDPVQEVEEGLVHSGDVEAGLGDRRAMDGLVVGDSVAQRV
jgi:hypothetical protein